VPAIRGVYGGTVGVSASDPGDAWAEGTADFEIVFPEATCRAQVTSRLRSDARTYGLSIDLVVSEDDQERWHRTWEREFPRDRQ